MAMTLTAAEPAFLEGIRVYDASMGVAGPHCASLLALAGAEVIKVEPRTGDWSRGMGRNAAGQSAYFAAYNRGKRSVSIDLKHPQGRDVARRLMQSCDLVVESFRPGVMSRLGLDYDCARAARPGILYASVSGFGSTGPLAGRPALDTVIQAFSGWLDLNRAHDGSPVLMRQVAVDVLTGLYAFQACLLGLIRKFRYGTGGRIEVSLLAAATAFLSPKIIEHMLASDAPGNNIDVPMGVWRTRDGFIAIAVKDQLEFTRLCEALHVPALALEPRFCTRTLRQQNGIALSAVLDALLLPMSAADVETTLAQVQVAAAKVRSFDEFLAEAHVCDAGLVGTAGDGMPFVAVPGMASPATLADAPRLGQHTGAALAEVGIGPAELDALAKLGVVG